MILPPVGFGTYLMDKDVCRDAVKRALEVGYRHIDTASGYNNEGGVREGIEASKIDRNLIFITTKLWPGGKFGQPPKTYDEVLEDGEKSKEALGSIIDLYLIHAPFAFGSGEEAGLAQWRACLELKNRGVAKEVGVSNFGIQHLQAIEKAGLELPTYNQLELHPCCQQRELVAWLRERGIGVIAYSSLAPLGSWRVGQDSGKNRMGEDLSKRVDDIVGKISKGKGEMTEAQVLLRWALEKGYAILPKSTNVERMKLNLKVNDDEEMSLSREEIEELDGLGEGGDVPCAWGFGNPTE